MKGLSKIQWDLHLHFLPIQNLPQFPDLNGPKLSKHFLLAGVQ